MNGLAGPPAREEDSLLRDRILAGDRTAAESLVDRHLDALYEFVHYRLGPERDATEDVVQDTFLVVLEKIGDFDGRSGLHTWICGIAKNKIRERRRARRPIPLDDLLEEADPEIERILAGVEREPLPEWVLEAKETSELVGAVLSSLPPEYRRALLAKYLEDLPVAEIARRTGRGEKAVESLLTRARTAFARVLALLANRRRGAA
ncbi:MAG TPA: RNA polymerase sigma factor [Planctomycetota bacterium]|jgi:RNA polymerase sigma-70 factor (ECF subfamily)|nr:RNA polymerase sigma factor [Planctomycetota bacterium]